VEERGHGFDAVPEILQTQVFVGAVLIVIVVRDGNGDGAGPSRTFHRAKRNASTHRGPLNDSAARRFYRTQHFFGMGRWMGVRAALYPAKSFLISATLGCCQQNLATGRPFNDEIALRADVIDDAVLLLPPVDADNQTQV
jgi:hypothetical protein